MQKEGGKNKSVSGNFWILIRKVKHFDQKQNLYNLVDQSKFLAAKKQNLFQVVSTQEKCIKIY